MKKQANKTASSGSSDKDSSAESSAPEEGEPSSPNPGRGLLLSVEDARSYMEGKGACITAVHNLFSGPSRV